MKGGRGNVVIAGLGLGLAGGMALGTYVLAPNLPGGISEQGQSLVEERDQAQATAEIEAAQVKGADTFIDSFASTAVSGVLADKSVVIIRTEDALNEDVTAVQGLVKAAGVSGSSTISLTKKFFDQSGADGLKTLVTNTLPAGAKLSENRLDPGTHSGEYMASLVMLDPQSAEPQASEQERTLGLDALADGGYIEAVSTTVAPADVAILVVGDSAGNQDNGFAETSQAAFSQAMDSHGGGLVVAGQIHTTSPEGVIGKIRADEKARDAISTVDSVDRSWGQIATVLAASDQLAGKSGAYGIAASADAVSPAVK